MYAIRSYYDVHPDVAIDGQTTYQAADQNSIPDYGYITVVAPTNGQVLSRTASAMKLPSGTVLRSPATLERYVSFAAIHPLAALSLRARFGISYDGTNFATSGFASGIYECSPGVTNQAVFTHSFADLTLTNDAWIVADTSVVITSYSIHYTKLYENRQLRVQRSPIIIKLAVPAFQHSPLFGQFPLV